MVTRYSDEEVTDKMIRELASIAYGKDVRLYVRYVDSEPFAVGVWLWIKSKDRHEKTSLREVVALFDDQNEGLRYARDIQQVTLTYSR